MSNACYACCANDAVHDGPVTEAIHVEGAWRVAHAFNTSLRGWLVLVPRRHVAAVEDLSASEAAAMGALIRRCAKALRETTGCTKTYFMFYAEAEGFSHLHVHVVPRMNWFGPDETGPRVFSLVGLAEADCLTADEQTAFATRVRLALATCV